MVGFGEKWAALLLQRNMFPGKCTHISPSLDTNRMHSGRHQQSLQIGCHGAASRQKPRTRQRGGVQTAGKVMASAASSKAFSFAPSSSLPSLHLLHRDTAQRAHHAAGQSGSRAPVKIWVYCFQTLGLHCMAVESRERHSCPSTRVAEGIQYTTD